MILRPVAGSVLPSLRNRVAANEIDEVHDQFRLPQMLASFAVIYRPTRACDHIGECY